MISVFQYTDYRKFLTDYYVEQKKAKKHFSHRYFAKRAKVNSSGLYQNITKGRQGLSRNLIIKFSEAMSLSKKEQAYFESLVFFNDAKTVEEKKLYFEKMISCRESKARMLDKYQYEYYSKWYYSAIREMMSFWRIKDQYEEIAKFLNPSIRPDQVKKSLKILEKLGLAQKDDDGFYRQSGSIVTTGAEVQSLNVANYQRSMQKLALEAYDRHPAKTRDMSTLSLSVNEELFQTIKAEIIAFRKKLLNFEQRHISRSDRVYQINMQCFPLTKGRQQV